MVTSFHVIGVARRHVEEFVSDSDLIHLFIWDRVFEVHHIGVLDEVVEGVRDVTVWKGGRAELDGRWS